MFEGHSADHVTGAHVVVTSTAVRPDNPEVAEARRLGVPVIPRAEMLAELMRLKYGVAVAGSHGKTTTTSMVALVLDKGGLDPTVVVGGRLNVLGSGARLGKGEFLVAEADESDRSFLKLTPTLAVVTNIDREHLDAYRDLADVQEAFVGFVNKVPFYGCAVMCLDDAPTAAILPRVERRVVTYGLTPKASVSARDLKLGPTGSRYTATHGGRPLGPDHAGGAGRPQRARTRSPRWRWASTSSCRSRRSSRASPPSAASTGASRCAARRAACW